MTHLLYLSVGNQKVSKKGTMTKSDMEFDHKIFNITPLRYIFLILFFWT